MRPLEIAPEVFWVGTLDPNLRVFDIIMRADRGTTYNAYLIRGREKTALVETVKDGFHQEFFDKVSQLVPLDQIDYIIVNHHEPDHSGTLKYLLEEAKRAQVVISKTGAHFLRHILNRDAGPKMVGDGDRIDLGGKTLSFISAPFLHWPDTMFTYLEEDHILFPCDFLGSHYSDERVFSDLIGDFSYEFKYYYDHIMRPFKEYVLAALEKLEPLKISMVCPGHGPILRHGISERMEDYRRWSQVPTKIKKEILIFYASAYGNTMRMAREVAKGLEEANVAAELFDLTSIDISSVLDRIESADGILIGTVTINGDAVKPVWDLLSSLATLKLKGKIAGAFGSYGWSGEAVPMVEERLKSLRFRQPESGLRFYFVPTDDELAAGRQWGLKIGEQIK